MSVALAGALLFPALAGGAASGVPRYLGPKPPAEVGRVVTLAPSLTDTVLALGAGEKLVGVTRFDERPEVVHLPRVGGFVDPSVESVVALRPDLVLVQPAPGNRQAVETLAKVGISVLALPLHSVASTLLAIREVGHALGFSEKAAELAAGIVQRQGEIRARGAKLSHPRVLLVYGFAPLIVAGPGSFADELLADAGAVNAAANASLPYTPYSAESAVRARPDIVVDAADVSLGAEKLRELAGLKEARWVKVSSRDLLHPGPNLGRGLEELFHLLYPQSVP